MLCVEGRRKLKGEILSPADLFGWIGVEQLTAEDRRNIRWIEPEARTALHRLRDFRAFFSPGRPLFDDCNRNTRLLVQSETELTAAASTLFFASAAPTFPMPRGRCRWLTLTNTNCRVAGGGGNVLATNHSAATQFGAAKLRRRLGPGSSSSWVRQSLASAQA
eukprot:3001012-Rhodomonas_salina.3